MDVWPGEREGDEPCVYHGHTMTSRLQLNTALAVIKEYAFECSSYPLILRLEQHLETSEQRLLVDRLRSAFGDSLYVPPSSPNAICPQPCPQLFTKKILIAVSHTTCDVSWLIDR